MIKKIILLLFVVITFCCFTNNSSYVNYHKKTVEAEIYIADSNYSHALLVYKELFNAFPHGFYKDYHNAALCAIKTDNFKDALNFFKALVLHGYTLKDFNNPAFDGFRNNTKQWNKFLSEYEKWRKQYEEQLNTPLREQYSLLFQTDQQFAKRRIDDRIRDSVFYELALSVSSLIKTNGFPCWMINKDTINSHLYAMFRHYCGLSNRIKVDYEMQQDSFYIRMCDNDIPILVNNAFEDGWLLPAHYAGITTYSDKNLYGEISVEYDFEKEEVRPYLRLSAEEKEKANQRRQAIGLVTVNEESQKIINLNYPFKEIKEIWAKCDTCYETLDYILLERQIIGTLMKDEDVDTRNGFILQKIESNNIYYTGTPPYKQSEISPAKNEK
jgi:hypothetical protein